MKPGDRVRVRYEGRSVEARVGSEPPAEERADEGPNLRMVLVKKFDRQCGECTLCCKLLPMSPELFPRERVAETVDAMIDAGWNKPSDFAGMRHEWTKPAGEPCQHQRHRKGCAIYAERPFCCREWSCRWLTGTDTADQRRPDRSRVVIDLVPDFITIRPNDGGEPTNIQVVQLWCDPKAPDAWRDPPMLAFIERRAHEGIVALVRFDNKRAITVFAPPLCGDGQWHEVDNGELRPEHVGKALIDGLSTSRKVVLG
jgi:hypothetical protein